MKVIFFTNILVRELFRKTDIIEEVCTECKITTSNINIWGKRAKYCPLCGREVSERKVTVNNYNDNVIRYFRDTFSMVEEDLDKEVFIEPYRWKSMIGIGFYKGEDGNDYIGCEVKVSDDYWIEVEDIHESEKILIEFMEELEMPYELKLRISN